MQTNKVIAVDQGNTDSAYVIWDGVQLHGFDKVSNATMRQVLRDFISQTPGGVVATEQIAPYGMSVGKEVFETCVMVGRLVQICEDLGVQTQLVYRQDCSQVFKDFRADDYRLLREWENPVDVFANDVAKWVQSNPGAVGFMPSIVREMGIHYARITVLIDPKLAAEQVEKAKLAQKPAGVAALGKRNLDL